MKQAILTVGISASGKSTDALKWLLETQYAGRMEINRNAIRISLMKADGNEFSWDKWNWKREGEVTKIAEGQLSYAALHELDVYISDTNLKQKYRSQTIKKLEDLGYEVEIREFPITLEEALVRDSKRENGVGHSAIAKQYEEWLEYKLGVCGDERGMYEPDVTKPKCILVDIDGTHAHMNGKPGAFDWNNVGVDDCDEMMKAEEIQKINDDYKNMHKIFDKYFRNKPAFDDLEKASYAYHFKNRDDVHAHSFYNNLKSLNLDYADNSKKFLHEKCEWCCQSRIQIRWGDNPKCGSRPKEANGSIAETLKDEETSYFALLERGKDDIPAMVKRKFGGTVSAEALFYCQTTLGYEPDIVSGIMDIDIEKMMPQYEVLMNKHRGKS